MSISMCIQDRVPALCSSRFTNTGAKKGFLASKGLQKWKLILNWFFKTIVESLKWIKTKCRSCYTVFFLKRQSHHWQPLVYMIHKLSATDIQLGENCAANDMLWFNPVHMHLIARFSIECRKTKTKTKTKTNYLPIRLLNQSQTAEKPKPMKVIV